VLVGERWMLAEDGCGRFGDVIQIQTQITVAPAEPLGGGGEARQAFESGVAFTVG
jgi:hypothetical protein